MHSLTYCFHYIPGPLHSSFLYTIPEVKTCPTIAVPDIIDRHIVGPTFCLRAKNGDDSWGSTNEESWQRQWWWVHRTCQAWKRFPRGPDHSVVSAQQSSMESGVGWALTNAIHPQLINPSPLVQLWLSPRKRGGQREISHTQTHVHAVPSCTINFDLSLYCMFWMLIICAALVVIAQDADD